ncbi:MULTISPECIES: hypothetical protein [unclassified Rhizobium]|jgi:hypothetical protein|uniref:hypothetical protein n=1 Tax=unclassified Rhizobium TaxID=2613769 RepID=UPI000647495E|nr:MULTISPECIES: hypothetical protein [unclassified Rhizobium]OJY68201.1 MAG: hypothetical protein BGP09_27860 [Rhizobium sp. 60-20]
MTAIGIEAAAWPQTANIKLLDTIFFSIEFIDMLQDPYFASEHASKPHSRVPTRKVQDVCETDFEKTGRKLRHGSASPVRI